jgi:VWFA-related protein
LYFFALGAAGQSQNPTNPAGDESKQEHSQETTTTFQLHVNLVEVYVVVRDSKGIPVPDLKKEDFRLYDKGKLQTITNFAVETPESRKKAALAKITKQIGENPAETSEKALPPDHFVAVMFDDTHLTDGDLMYARNSVSQFLDTLGPTERIGFYSTSGQFTHEFSADKEELKRSLVGLVSRPSGMNTPNRCPNVSYYMAHVVETLNDQNTYQVIVEDTLQCAFGGDRNSLTQARSMAESAIRQAAAMGQADNNAVFDNVQAVLRRLTAMPGERAMIFVSPGFSLTENRDRYWRMVDEANRARILINTLDARGLYASGMGSISGGGVPNQQLSSYRAAAQAEQSVVLQELADGTGALIFTIPMILQEE